MVVVLGQIPPRMHNCCQILSFDFSRFTLEQDTSSRHLTLRAQLLFHVCHSMCVQVTSVGLLCTHSSCIKPDLLRSHPQNVKSKEIDTFYLFFFSFESFQYLYSRYSLTEERDLGKIIHNCRTNWQLQ